MSARRLRSVLFMPGANRRAMARARTLPCDAVILDLEDAVAPASKRVARDAVVAELQAGGFAPRTVVVRINALDTPWGAEDLAAVAGLPGVDALLVPKVESPAALEAVAAALPPSAPTELWAMIETPRAVLAVERIAAAGGRLTTLVAGTSDLTAALGARHVADRLPMLVPLALTVIAARAHGLRALDGVHLALGDDTGLAAACAAARDLGFDGKTLIHPGQVDAANAAFSPDAAQVVHARAVVAAWERAEAAGQGVVVVDGRLVENLHVAEARRVLAGADGA